LPSFRRTARNNLPASFGEAAFDLRTFRAVARVHRGFLLRLKPTPSVSFLVRQTGQSLAVQFILPVSVERDLLIRKLFTAGLDTTHVNTSMWIATSTMLASIWNLRTEMLKSGIAPPLDAAVASPVEKLPAQSLVIPPQRQKVRLSELVENRRAIAA
jgi:hypothetical protein